MALVATIIVGSLKAVLVKNVPQEALANLQLAAPAKSNAGEAKTPAKLRMVEVVMIMERKTNVANVVSAAKKRTDHVFHGPRNLPTVKTLSAHSTRLNQIGTAHAKDTVILPSVMLTNILADAMY